LTPHARLPVDGGALGVDRRVIEIEYRRALSFVTYRSYAPGHARHFVVARSGTPIFSLEKPIHVAPANQAIYELSFSMRSFLAILFMLVALWQVAGGGKFDLATATLAIAASWFLSLFVGD
jgi:hypothetical protein